MAASTSQRPRRHHRRRPGRLRGGAVAAQLGAEVTVVDTDGLGGSAVLTDCVPSKTLIATAELMTDVAGAAELGVSFARPRGRRRDHASRVDLARVNARVKQLAADQSADIAAASTREGVTVVARPRPARRPGPRRGRPAPTAARRRSRPTPSCVATGAAPAHAADRAARRRADPHLGAGLRPRRAARRS